MRVSLNGISKSFSGEGNRTSTILENVCLELKTGESVVFHGPNGCGKSTLANIIAGIDDPSSGSLKVTDSSSNSPPVGYVFQDYGRSLLPWFSVLQNISLPMRLSGASHKQCIEKIEKLQKETNIGPLPLDRYPYQLSGGQQQRAAILRALVASGEFIILDEPFSSLDQRSSTSLQQLVQGLRLREKSLILAIIHDLDDAIFLADRVICLGGSPTTIVADIQVPLSWPRDQEVRIGDQFLSVRREVMENMGILHGQ